MGIEVGADMQSDVVWGRLGLGVEERGATAVEYALLMTLIAVAIIGGVALFGEAIRGLFEFDFPG
ncbi:MULTISPECIES: Flp family type IVb pilin [unclassified Nocardioides]|uniref:Flp family type IVb pilin n=1 Tax=unclassified Nocardioides TaxID=2615069 RepID=UPI0019102E0F|nr:MULTISPECIES: Flp family type IVb pilin [unclassified Nocardioides]